MVVILTPTDFCVIIGTFPLTLEVREKRYDLKLFSCTVHIDEIITILSRSTSIIKYLGFCQHQLLRI